MQLGFALNFISPFIYFIIICNFLDKKDKYPAIKINDWYNYTHQKPDDR